MFEIDVCYKFIFESMLEDDVLGYIANKVYEYTHAGIFFVSESGEILAYACSGKDQSMRSIIEGHVTLEDYPYFFEEVSPNGEFQTVAAVKDKKKNIGYIIIHYSNEEFRTFFEELGTILTETARQYFEEKQKNTYLVPTADAAGSAANSAASSLPLAAPSSKAESSAVSGAAAESVESRDNLLGLTAAEAKAMLADPLMILVNHTNQMPENYTFETAECGSKTAVNKTLQTVACNAFLELQKAAAAENVTVWMQSGYRSVSYQTNLYEKKTNYYKQQGYDDAKAREMAAAIVNPPGYSEHNCGLAADLNSPEHTGLDEGFENTAAFRWLCQHAGEYGFILRYPKGAEEKTEITYEPWHWRYVGVENAAKINASGLCFEDYIAALQQIAG